MELLAYKVERYNGGESTSIRVEEAESILQSNLYTISIYLKSFIDIERVVKEVKENSILKLYSKGYLEIEKKLKEAKRIHKQVLKNKINVAYDTYQITLGDGINGFFKKYNPEFEAYETHITADYPLCNPIESKSGIEFILSYLQAIDLENKFCSWYRNEDIYHLLCGVDREYNELIFNIYEIVLCSAAGCLLCGRESKGLNLSESSISYLYRSLDGKSETEIQNLFFQVYDEMKKELCIEEVSQAEYLEKGLLKIAGAVHTALAWKGLKQVFPIPDFPESKTKFFFSFGEKMQDEAYRILVRKLLQCRCMEERLEMIKREITSFADLEDIFFDAELREVEIKELLNTLASMEIAALAVRHNLKREVECMEDLNEAEQTFRRCLKENLESRNAEEKRFIHIIMEDLEIN